MKLSILGPPGSGKGTYCKILEKKFGLKVIAVGRILREMARSSDFGRELKEKYWGKGDLIPSDIAMDIIKDNVPADNFIFDGFPREVEEAESAEQVVKLDKVIFLNVPETEIIFRLKYRVQCVECGLVFHLKNKPPKDKNVCDRCGGKLYIREDDKDEKTIKERIKVYHEETENVIAHYRSKGLLVEVDGEGTIDEIFSKIEVIIENLAT